MNAVDILIKARSVIAKPEHWCQRLNATDEDGTPVKIQSPHASRYCAIGAWSLVTWGNTTERTAPHYSYLALLHAVPNFVGISRYNDMQDTTHDDILALYDRAIGSLRNSGHV